jgi:monooxygenase
VHDVDVLIIGAGISGISAAVHLQQKCPTKTFAIAERRPRIGGTWDLFRYPGVRSDSDMYTLGFRFKPWTRAKAIADGPSILSYLDEAVNEHGLLNDIWFDHHVTRAAWSTDTAKWTIELVAGPDRELTTVRCSFVFVCGGYYNYDHGYVPEFADIESFGGEIVHPQHWPDQFDYAGKKVVVIGSGATAVTLVPALAAGGAGHVTMLQRSPTYVASRPSEDKTANAARRILPAKIAYGLIRWRNVLFGSFLFNLARRKPATVKQKLIRDVSTALGPDYDVETHFTPTYNPWDQRLCLVPDGDMFDAIRNGTASVVTAHIDRFTKTGIRLQDGSHLDADIIVTATGLNLQMLGGVEIEVDGTRVKPENTVLHKGVMLSGIPNLAMWFGYTNASWTLKADLTSEYMCRVLNHMESTGTTMVMPDPHPNVAVDTFVDFTSGYFARAQHLLPKQGTALPWRLHQSYIKDVRLLRHGDIVDEGLTFSRPRVPALR